jgi:hypothetical protein
MTEQKRTICVGRYLVDVPAQSATSLSRERIAGFAVESVEEDETAFRERIAAREATIADNSDRATGVAPSGMVSARDLRVPGIIGRALVFGRRRIHAIKDGRRVDEELVSVEAHAHIGGVSFSLFKEIAGEADIDLASLLLARLQLREENEIPPVPGFCIEHAIFTEPLPLHRTEHAVLHLGLPGHPDLKLTFASMPGDASDHGLLARTAEVDADASAEELLRVSKLRSDKRRINGLEGEEVVERVREYNFTTGYAFNWETQGLPDDPLRPFLSLEMQTGISARPGGKPVDTSLHEDALLALWDSIASSIRLRRNEPPPGGPPPEPPGPKLGTIVRAGDICPQTGWWQCDPGSPGLDVHGGQVHYLRKGERMPQALLLPRQSLWQKVKRVQPSMESEQATAWTLVDKRQRPRIAPAVAIAQPTTPAASANLVDGRGGVAPLGTYARTGEFCPASGWWRCEESHALDGARWFARGNVLPAATFQVPTGIFARPGGPEFIQRRSGWQLMRYADSPGVSQPAYPISSEPTLDGPPAPA